MNTKQQGNVGIGKAIAYFLENGYTVSIPINDSQAYDLIVDKNNQLSKVQIKTTRHKNQWGNYKINLSTKGGNQSFNTVKKFDNSLVDLIFIYCFNEDMYLLSSSEVLCTDSLILGKKYKHGLVSKRLKEIDCKSTAHVLNS